MHPVFAFYRLTHGPEGPTGLVDALRSAAAAAHLEPGCRASQILQEADDSGGVLLVEEWETPQDLERHIHTPVFRRVLAVLELSHTPPDVMYVESARLRGIEWIAEVLGKRSES